MGAPITVNTANPAPIAAKALRFELLRENWEYRWYSANGVWRHKSHIRSQPIDTGTVKRGIHLAKKAAKIAEQFRRVWADPGENRSLHKSKQPNEAS